MFAFFGWRNCNAACFTLAVALVCVPAVAQLADPHYQVGDLVELYGLGGWVPGVVVDVDVTGKTVKARVDEKDVKDKHRRALLASQKWASDYFLEQVRARKGAVPKPDLTELRSWSDLSGKFKVDARFVDVPDGKVWLDRADGKRIEVPLERLSPTDAQYLKTVRPGSAEGAPVKNAGGPHLPRILQPKSFSKWDFVPGTVVSPELPPQESVVVEMPHLKAVTGVMERVKDIYLSRDGRIAWVVRYGWVAGMETPCFLQVVDLETKHAGALIPLAQGQTVLDALPENGLMLTRTDANGHWPGERVDVVRVEGEHLSPVASWVPYEKEDTSATNVVNSAWLLGTNRIMTLRQNGDSYWVWDIEGPRAVYRIPIGVGLVGQTTKAFSDDRRLMALSYVDTIAIVDLVSGAHKASIATPGMRWDPLRFRPDNQVLAGQTWAKELYRWDLGSGKEIDHFASDDLKRTSSIVEWIGNDVIEAGARYCLFDVARHKPFWHYQMSTGTLGEKLYARQLAFVPIELKDDVPMALCVARLPLADARGGQAELAKGEPITGSAKRRPYGFTWLKRNELDPKADPAKRPTAKEPAKSIREQTKKPAPHG
jgi:hypothetical protein